MPKVTMRDSQTGTFGPGIPLSLIPSLLQLRSRAMTKHESKELVLETSKSSSSLTPCTP
ncbi:uncharacterized protein CTRU02_213995 [Colletotrichum truncatum]|uniref:Uncharacterized protein n=1 Tax=Colletotrichum truncatum TaxID=5467 RepID=A0ACC3YHA4_COLTU